MAREIDLLGYWMPVLRQLKEFKEIAKAETPELKYILEQVERTLNNMIAETILAGGARAVNLLSLYHLKFPEDTKTNAANCIYI